MESQDPNVPEKTTEVLIDEQKNAEGEAEPVLTANRNSSESHDLTTSERDEGTSTERKLTTKMDLEKSFFRLAINQASQDLPHSETTTGTSSYEGNVATELDPETNRTYSQDSTCSVAASGTSSGEGNVAEAASGTSSGEGNVAEAASGTSSGEGNVAEATSETSSGEDNVAEAASGTSSGEGNVAEAASGTSSGEGNVAEASSMAFSTIGPAFVAAMSEEIQDDDIVAIMVHLLDAVESVETVRTMEDYMTRLFEGLKPNLHLILKYTVCKAISSRFELSMDSIPRSKSADAREGVCTDVERALVTVVEGPSNELEDGLIALYLAVRESIERAAARGAGLAPATEEPMSEGIRWFIGSLARRLRGADGTERGTFTLNLFVAVLLMLKFRSSNKILNDNGNVYL